MQVPKGDSGADLITHDSNLISVQVDQDSDHESNSYFPEPKVQDKLTPSSKN